MANLCTNNYHPTGVPYHFHTLYHRPRSSPQVTMPLPVEAMRKHYQDQISRGRKNKHTNKNRKRDVKGTHRKCRGKKRKHKIIPYLRSMENKILLVSCQSKPQMLGQTLQSRQWREICLAPHIGWYLLNSIYYQWSRDKISQHHWQSLPQ